MKIKLLLICPVLLLSACSTLVSNFDQNTYVAASDIKLQSLELISHASDPASSHQADIDALSAKLSAQLSYELGKGASNSISYHQWSKVGDSNGNLLGKFLGDWNGGKTFSSAYIQEKSSQISDAFDEILRLEGAKSR